jgi:hypothetical protein
MRTKPLTAPSVLVMFSPYARGPHQGFDLLRGIQAVAGRHSLRTTVQRRHGAPRHWGAPAAVRAGCMPSIHSLHRESPRHGLCRPLAPRFGRHVANWAFPGRRIRQRPEHRPNKPLDESECSIYVPCICTWLPSPPRPPRLVPDGRGFPAAAPPDLLMSKSREAPPAPPLLRLRRDGSRFRGCGESAPPDRRSWSCRRASGSS